VARLRALRCRVTGRRVPGWFGLRVHADRSFLAWVIGCIVASGAKDFATEGSIALIDYAFAQLDASAVHADTMFINQASRRVMEKCGMTYVKTYHVSR